MNKRKAIKRIINEYNWVCRFDDYIEKKKGKFYLIISDDYHEAIEKVINPKKAVYLNGLSYTKILRITRKQAKKLYKLALYYNELDKKDYY